jgi:DNA-binding Lrp family transcriptional regulator
MLTNTQIELISALEEDGRLRYAELAEKLGISLSTVSRNLKTMSEEKIYKISAIPNTVRLGHKAFALIALNVNMGNVYDLCKKIRNNCYVNLIHITYGLYNVVLLVQFPNWDDLHYFISSDVFTKPYIRDCEIFFMRDVRKHFPHHWDKATPADLGPIEIDETDQKIIEELVQSGNYSAAYLARKLGINVTLASRRLNSLIKENAVSIQAMPNEGKIGYNATAFVLLRAEYNKIDDICERLSSVKEIVNIMTLVNGYQILLRVIARNLETVNELVIKKIPLIPGITSFETLIGGERVKQYYGLRIKDMLSPEDYSQEQ